jgi:NADH-quinone oxidoreductase subunit C
MALTPAVTDIEQLKDRPVVSRLLDWNPDAIDAIQFDRNELTIWVPRNLLCETASLLKDLPELAFTYLADLTCVDWYPREPRFEVVYHLLSMARRERVRLKVRLEGSDPVVDSVTPLWAGANFAEREVFDLFGIRFEGHPYLRRIMLPENWEGHPLRKDYPVEGYR